MPETDLEHVTRDLDELLSLADEACGWYAMDLGRVVPEMEALGDWLNAYDERNFVTQPAEPPTSCGRDICPPTNDCRICR